MSKLHNLPQTEVIHRNVLDGTFSGTVTLNVTNLYAGNYDFSIAFSTAAVSKASTVQIFPFANSDHDAIGTAIDFSEHGGTANSTVAIGTGTNADVEHTDTHHFCPFGVRVVFSTTSATGSGTIDFFARLDG